MKTVALMAFCMVVTMALIEQSLADTEPEEDRLFWGLFQQYRPNRRFCKKCREENTYSNRCCQRRGECCVQTTPTTASSIASSTVSPTGTTVSNTGTTVSSTGTTVSPTGTTVSPTGTTVSPTGSSITTSIT